MEYADTNDPSACRDIPADTMRNMQNFVDIHHHLIYGVDDGAHSLDMMKEMILRAAEEGVTDLVCTSHVTPGYKAFPLERYYRHMEQAKEFIREQGLDLWLYPGCEVLYTDASARLLQEHRFPTLADTDVVLVEFSPDVSMAELEKAATSFRMAGFRVIFAHVERYSVLRSMKHVRRLHKQFGVYMQMNASTIINRKSFFTDRWVKRMITEGYIDCAATDSHNLSSRSCRMRQCYQTLAEKFGQDVADELCGGFQRRLLEL